MGPGLQGGARRIPALLGVIFIYEVGAAAAMARSDADRELQCVPVDLDGVLLVLSARHQPATRGRRWTVPGAGAVLIQSWRMMVQRKFKTGR